MGLVEHAERELRLAGLFDTDSDYNGALGPAVMKLVEVFAAEDHSGFSAGLTLHLFDTVARFKTLSPVTSNPDEWMDIGEYSPGTPMWQSTRNPSLFSHDRGKTWYDVDNLPWRMRWSRRIRRFFS